MANEKNVAAHSQAASKYLANKRGRAAKAQRSYDKSRTKGLSLWDWFFKGNAKGK